MITVNSMVSGIRGALQMQKAQESMLNSANQLTSGSRINSAKDDPAGLAIAALMSSQIRGNSMAIRNANDGISLSQVADGALSEADGVLQRMRELAVQAGNGTLSQSNRDSIQNEINQLSEQLSDIGNTKFNGASVFAGSSLNFQIGADASSSVSLNLSSFSAAGLSGNASSTGADVDGGRVDNNATDAGDITINGVDVGATLATDSAADKADLINDVSGQTGVTASASNLVQGGSANPYAVASAGIQVDVGGNTVTLGATSSLQDFVNQFNRDVGGAEARIDENGAVQIFNDTGETITLTDNATGSLGNLGLQAGEYTGSIALNSSDGSDIEIGLGENGQLGDLQAFGLNEQSDNDISGQAVSGQAISESDAIQINGVDLGAVGTGGTASAGEIAQAINDISDETGVSASASTQVDLSANVSALNNNASLTINGVDVFDGFTGTSLDDVVSQINNAGLSGVTASATTDGQLRLSSASGETINIENGNTAFSQDGAAIAASFEQTGELELTSDNGGEISITSNAAIGDQASAVEKLGLSDTGGFETASAGNVASAENAGDLLSSIDSLIADVSSLRANLGASQSRFESSINNLYSQIVNEEASRSRIQDSDFAKAATEFFKSQVQIDAGNIVQVQSQNAQRGFISQLLGQ